PPYQTNPRCRPPRWWIAANPVRRGAAGGAGSCVRTSSRLGARGQPVDQALGAADHLVGIPGEGEAKKAMAVLAVEVGAGSEGDAGVLEYPRAQVVRIRGQVTHVGVQVEGAVRGGEPVEPAARQVLEEVKTARLNSSHEKASY